MTSCAQLTFLLLALPALSTAFSIVRTSPNTTSATAGETLRLSCFAGDSYEFCVWRHNSDICEFEWKKSHEAVKKQRCSNGFKNRVAFKGDYNTHECAIEVSGIRLEDAGLWTCEMEDYVWGPARGAVHKKPIVVTVNRVGEEEDLDDDEEYEEVNDIGERIGESSDLDETTAPVASPTVSTKEVKDESKVVFEEEDEGEEDKTREETKFDIMGSGENSKDGNLTADEAATLHNLTNTLSEDESLIMTDEDSEPQSGFPYAALILGVFGALFVVFLAVGGVYYRRSKKLTLEADWRQRQEEKIMSEENRLELNKIIEETEQNQVVPRGNGAMDPQGYTSHPLEAVPEEEDGEGKRVTYNGSRAYDYE